MKGQQTMKKKCLILPLLASALISSTGCGQAASSSVNTDTSIDNDFNIDFGIIQENQDTSCLDKDTSFKDITPEEYNDFFLETAEVYRNYITLPSYRHLDVNLPAYHDVVSAQSIDDKIESVLEQCPIPKDNETTSVGDTIVLDYKGTIDGSSFSGGSSLNVKYTIGSKKFLDDLDSGLVGLKAGKNYYINCKYPDDYSYESLRGKNAVFEVTIKSISSHDIQNFNKEWFSETLGVYNADISSADEFRTYVKHYLRDQLNPYYSSEKTGAILDKIKELTTIKNGYPSKEYNSLKENNSGQDGSEVTEEDIEDYLLEKMIITLIAYDNGITVTANDINLYGEELAEYNDYDSLSELISTYGKQLYSEFGYDILSMKVKYLLDTLYD
jgi:trigger factor